MVDERRRIMTDEGVHGPKKMSTVQRIADALAAYCRALTLRRQAGNDTLFRQQQPPAGGDASGALWDDAFDVMVAAYRDRCVSLANPRGELRHYPTHLWKPYAHVSVLVRRFWCQYVWSDHWSQSTDYVIRVQHHLDHDYPTLLEVPARVCRGTVAYANGLVWTTGGTVIFHPYTGHGPRALAECCTSRWLCSAGAGLQPMIRARSLVSLVADYLGTLLPDGFAADDFLCERDQRSQLYVPMAKTDF